MKLRGTRQLREIAAMGIKDARLACRDCKNVSAVGFSQLQAQPDATFEEATSVRVPCPECGSLRTDFLPLELEKYFQA
jgi:hypothetical protein